MRPVRAVVIPVITFVECGMEFSMGKVTGDFLILYRLCPT